MDDYRILWYILAAVIYFLTRGKKKKNAPKRPGTENNPAPQEPKKSFEELLKEITGESVLEQEEPEVVVEKKQPVSKPYEETRDEENEEEKRAAAARRLEGEKRAFADEESRRVYEESIKRAEGSKIDYEPDENYAEPRLFRDKNKVEEEVLEETTFADEIRKGLTTGDAKKAVIYAEILQRKY